MGRHVYCKECEKKRTYDLCACGGQKVKVSQSCLSCRQSNQWGPANPAWKGGRSENAQGYITVCAPRHPRAHKNGRVLEHILVMEEKLGRSLWPDEQVHHKNKIKDDNRPENLEVWTGSQPRGARAEDQLAWAREILDRYEVIVD
jgi:hypothetical protein